MIPYTYIIGWKTHNKYYYGVRYAKNCHPSDLWKAYFTSSRHVKSFREQHGEPDVIEVRKIFNSVEKAKLWEEKVLKRLKVSENDVWLNVTESGGPPILRGENNPFYDKKHSEKTMEILRRSKNDSHREKLRKPKIVYTRQQSHNNNISLSHKGITHSAETKQKLSNFFKKDRKKEPAILSKNGISIIVEDLPEFCNKNGLNLSNIRRTGPRYIGEHKSYTCKGYTLLT